MISLKIIRESRIRKEGVIAFPSCSFRIVATLSKFMATNPNLPDDKPIFHKLEKTAIPKWAVYNVEISGKVLKYYSQISIDPSLKDILIYLSQLAKMDLNHDEFFQKYGFNPEMESSHLTYRRIYREKDILISSIKTNINYLKELTF